MACRIHGYIFVIVCAFHEREVLVAFAESVQYRGTIFVKKKSVPQDQGLSSLGILVTLFNLPLLLEVIMPGLQRRVRNRKLFFLFLNQNRCCGYSKEPSQ